MDEVKIIVDYREMKSKVVKKLFELGAKIESTNLQVGDFILSESVCVERKTVKDFLQSIIDNRLFEQISNMVENFEKPIVIVEGSSDIYSERMMHPNAIRGAIAALAIDFRIPIIQTSSEEETALFLYLIAQREQLDLKKSIKVRGEKKPITDKFLQEYIVTSLPGIGLGIAKNLLKKFKTVEKVFTASKEELMNVEKIGKKKAEKIREILTKEYGE